MKRSKTEERTTDAALGKPYEPTLKELEAVVDMRQKREEAPLPSMSFSKEEGEGERILRATIAHSDPEVATAALQKALGQPWQEGLDNHLLQLSKVASDAQQPGASGYGVAYNAAIQAVAGIAPKDAVESMLAVQMVAIHNMTLSQAARAMAATDPVRREMAEKATNRLARTFAAQTEALKKYRSNSEQKIVVQHVNVSDNAQAIFSNRLGVGEDQGLEQNQETTP